MGYTIRANEIADKVLETFRGLLIEAAECEWTVDELLISIGTSFVILCERYERDVEDILTIIRKGRVQ